MNQTMVSQEERKAARKEIRKAGSHIGFGALLYVLIMSVVGAIAAIIAMIAAGPDVDVMTEQFEGIASLAGVLVALLVVFLCFVRKGTHKQLFIKNKTMTLGKFGALFCVMYLFTTVGNLIYMLLESGLNVLGFSTSVGLELASGKCSTLSMFLYVGVIGPIIEELVFRGFLLRRMEKHGKLIAIFATSLLFGLMHGNLPQVCAATMMGLVLGYIAMEYSIIWTTILHIFNNLVLCTLLYPALEAAGGTVLSIVDGVFTALTAIVAIVILVRNFKNIRLWIRNNMWSKKTLTWLLTSVGMILAIVCFVAITVGVASLG